MEYPARNTRPMEIPGFCMRCPESAVVPAQERFQDMFMMLAAVARLFSGIISMLMAEASGPDMFIKQARSQKARTANAR